MEPIAKIKKEMDFNKNLGSLVEVMKNIAVMEYHAFEKKVRTYPKFMETLESFSSIVSGQKIPHPFLNPRVKKEGIIAITSDVGLLGGLNMQILRAAVAEYGRHPGKLVVVGEEDGNICVDMIYLMSGFRE